MLGRSTTELVCIFGEEGKTQRVQKAQGSEESKRAAGAAEPASKAALWWEGWIRGRLGGDGGLHGPLFILVGDEWRRHGKRRTSNHCYLTYKETGTR